MIEVSHALHPLVAAELVGDEAEQVVLVEEEGLDHHVVTPGGHPHVTHLGAG